MAQSVRMVCASFLVEYLRVSWVDGELWFADTLCDADSAINAMMWQNAGRSGIDQWNFVMSPVNASQDPTGRYTRRYVPELAKLPNKLLHKPWLASPQELAKAGLVLAGGGGGGGGDRTRAGKVTGCSCYPVRVVTDLQAERRASADAVLAMRRAHQGYNDAKGYDMIVLPGGAGATKVFTKEEYRISKSGSVLPPPPRRNKGKGKGQGRGGTSKRAGGSSRGSAKGQRTLSEFFATRDNQ
jgi:hypothetical protein